ncbi:MAG: hypothetical protein H0V79_12365 [Actinobacteria bacterium]|nr:hypothetical protein [Actinomycetota bacterium]
MAAIRSPPKGLDELARAAVSDVEFQLQIAAPNEQVDVKPPPTPARFPISPAESKPAHGRNAY